MLLADAQQLVIHEFQGYAMGWGTLSLINAGLAQSKNRSGLTWWLVSLIIGPIATFAIVVCEPAPDRRKPPSTNL